MILRTLLIASVLCLVLVTGCAGSRSQSAEQPVTSQAAPAAAAPDPLAPISAYMADANRLIKEQEKAIGDCTRLLLKYEQLSSYDKESLHFALNEVDSATSSYASLAPPSSLAKVHGLNRQAMAQLGIALRSYNLYLASNRVMPSDMKAAESNFAGAALYRDKANEELQRVSSDLGIQLRPFAVIDVGQF